jgi:hypothetical protein
MAQIDEKQIFAKPLKKDEAGYLLPFMANGAKFWPIPDGAPLGPIRWSQYEKMAIAVGFGRNFKSLIDALKEVRQLQYEDKPAAQIKMETSAMLDSILDAAFSVKNDRFAMGFYLASIFIVREGDDPAHWDAGVAQSMIDDWAAENVSEQDLFFFALGRVHGFKAAWKSQIDETRAKAAKSLERIGWKAAKPNGSAINLSETFGEP